MTQICLVTALCDPTAELLGKALTHWRTLRECFDHIAVHATNDTSPDWLDFLADQGVPVASAKPGWDHIGLHRRRALELGLRCKANKFLYADPDHVLRWAQRHPMDLRSLPTRIGQSDCLVKSVVNRIFALVSGLEVDVMMAARGLTRRAAELIVGECRVDTLGNDVAWPLLVASRGMTLD